jgi:hypothetical protein
MLASTIETSGGAETSRWKDAVCSAAGTGRRITVGVQPSPANRGARAHRDSPFPPLP